MTTYTLMVETLNLLTEDEILEQSRTTLTDAQTVLVRDGTANVRGHKCVGVIEIELRQELLGFGFGIAAVVIATLVRVFGKRARELACHVGTGSIGQANDGWEEGQGPHGDVCLYSRGLAQEELS